MAAAPAGHLASVRDWLHGQGVTAVSDEWLAQCVEHVTESLGVVPSAADLQGLVLEQWLDADLATLAVASLPPRLADRALVTLRQPCAVQLLSAVDVSQPAHGQLLKLRQLDSANTEVGEHRAAGEPRPSRALRLSLSDGVQKVTALECEPLPALSADSPAGLKLVLRPPLECRRGVLLLAARSVSVLGGTVEELQEPRAAQRALEERLGAAGGLSSEPPIDDDSGYRSDQAAGAARGRPAAEPDPFDDDLDEAELAAIPDIPYDDLDDAELAMIEIPGDDAGSGDASGEAAVVFSGEDDVTDAELASLDLDGAVDGAVDRVTAPAPMKRRWPDPWDSSGTAEPQSRSAEKTNGAAGRGKLPRTQQRLEGFLRSGVLSSSQAPAAPMPAPSAGISQSQGVARRAASPVRAAPSFDLSSWLEVDDPAPPAEPPFGYLSDLQPGRPLTVKAFIMTMLNSLDMSGGRWRLEVKINDGTRSLDAVMSDAVLSEIIGLSVAEADRMRSAGRAELAVRARLKRALCAAQTAIIRLSCLMRLEAAGAPDQLPVISRLAQVDGGTVRALRACLDAG